jgi:hypothetical protein
MDHSEYTKSITLPNSAEKSKETIIEALKKSIKIP